MGFLTGKRFLITGVLSNRSIAYGVARACHAQGAELAFSYAGDRFKDRVTEYAGHFDSKLVFECDVSSDPQIDAIFKDLSQVWPQFDGFVHSIGFAPREAIAGDFMEGLTRENFRIAHDISAYSFPALAKAALPYLRPKAALLTMSYLGALRAVPNYNTMGLAKASLEASDVTWRPTLGPRTYASTASVLAPSRPWRPAASRTSASCWAWWRLLHRWGAMSPSTTWATSRPFCCRTWPAASPPK